MFFISHSLPRYPVKVRVGIKEMEGSRILNEEVEVQ
jgi:hypothetical protein